jgi:Zn-dependent oligopeptidase
VECAIAATSPSQWALRYPAVKQLLTPARPRARKRCRRALHEPLQAKERFNSIAEQLTELSTQFSNNVLDATKAFTKLLTTKDEVDGLPDSALALLAQQAKGKGHADATAEAGPWLVTLDIPAYLPIQASPAFFIVHQSAVCCLFPRCQF